MLISKTQKMQIFQIDWKQHDQAQLDSKTKTKPQNTKHKTNLNPTSRFLKGGVGTNPTQTALTQLRRQGTD